MSDNAFDKGHLPAVRCVCNRPGCDGLIVVKRIDGGSAQLFCGQAGGQGFVIDLDRVGAASLAKILLDAVEPGH